MGLELAVAEWLIIKARKLSDAQRSNLLHTAAVYLNGDNGRYYDKGKLSSSNGFSNISMMNCIWNVIPVVLSAKQMEHFENNYSNHALELLLEHGTLLSSFTRDQQKRISIHQARDLGVGIVRTEYGLLEREQAHSGVAQTLLDHPHPQFISMWPQFTPRD